MTIIDWTLKELRPRFFLCQTLNHEMLSWDFRQIWKVKIIIVDFLPKFREKT